MTSIAAALFETLGLHTLALPHLEVKPGQVQLIKGGAPLAGRFELDDIFDGDFSQIALNAASPMPDFSRALASEGAASVDSGLKGPLGALASAQVELAAQGARRIRLAGFNGHLVELKPGPLHAALNEATIRKSGPMARGDVAIIIVGVASLEVMSIALETELGARLQVEAAAQQALSASAGATVSRASSGDTTFAYDTAMPFAVQLWSVKWPVLGAKPRILPAKGPIGLLGDKTEIHPEFGEDIGSHDLIVDL